MSRSAFGLVALAVLGGPAAAQDAAPDGWVVDLGAVARTRPTHLGAKSGMVDVVPVIEATWRDRVTLSLDDGAKWTVGQVGPVAFGPIAEYRQSFNDDLSRGSFRMPDAVELGGFGQVRTPIGVAEARLRYAVNSYQGWSGDLAFNTGAQVTPKLEVGGQLRLGWADSNFSQEFFGLKPTAAHRFDLPRVLDNDYLTAGGEFDVARRLTPDMRLVMALSADRMLGEIPATPLVRTRNIYVASFGVTYRWGRGAR
jgi:outer membrane scaffolding protein for murein synthesis (MipA/OmpV family)